MKIYEFCQNNSGGSFDVNNNVCHRVFIEAEDYNKAETKALGLGVYFNGCDDGQDCSCCGDRWYQGGEHDAVDLDKINEKGYPVSTYKVEGEDAWHKKYGGYIITKEPEWEQPHGFKKFIGEIKFKSVEDYIQFLTDEYNWTSPDARIFYADGTIKEFFMKKEAET